MDDLSLRHLPDESFSFNIPTGYDQNLLDDDDFLAGANDTFSTPRVQEPLRLSELTPRTHRNSPLLDPTPVPPTVQREPPPTPTLVTKEISHQHTIPEPQVASETANHPVLDPPGPKLRASEPSGQSTKPASKQKPARPVTAKKVHPETKTVTPAIASQDVKQSSMPKAIFLAPPITLQAASTKEAEIVALFDQQSQETSSKLDGTSLLPLEPPFLPQTDPLTLSQLSPRKQTSSSDDSKPIVPPNAKPTSRSLKVRSAPSKPKSQSNPPAKPRIKPVVSKPVPTVSRPSSSSSQPRSKPTSEMERPKSRTKKPLSATSTNGINPRPESRESNESDALKKSYQIPDFKAQHAKYEAALSRSRPKVVPVVPLPILLSTDQRARERAKFDEKLKERERELEHEREERRRQREEEEEREFKELRRKAVPKAHEVPEWYRDAPRRQKDQGSAQVS